MLFSKFSKTVGAGFAFGVLVVTGMLISSPGRAANDNNGPQDEKLMIQLGFAVAPVTLKYDNKDADMVGLGSYLVNVAADCNGCHSAGPQTQYLPGHNPFFLNQTATVNPATYLGGGNDFGMISAPPSPHIISRNLTPDKTGLPEGHTLAQFIQIFRTGADLDHEHPNCSVTRTTNCFPLGAGLPPFNGDLLQVMPWPVFKSFTDRQLEAIYLYLKAVPCIQGGEADEPVGRCGS